MKKIITYHFENEDPDWARRLDEAFNLLRGFTPELNLISRGEITPYLTAHNRILLGNQFSAQDVKTLMSYGRTVANRAEDKYTIDPMKTAPWVESVKANITHLREILSEFEAWFENDGKPVEDNVLMRYRLVEEKHSIA
jgi:hypothetical protein